MVKFWVLFANWMQKAFEKLVKQRFRINGGVM